MVRGRMGGEKKVEKGVVWGRRDVVKEEGVGDSLRAVAWRAEAGRRSQGV